jgi:hypothetical protein
MLNPEGGGRPFLYSFFFIFLRIKSFFLFVDSKINFSATVFLFNNRNEKKVYSFVRNGLDIHDNFTRQRELAGCYIELMDIFKVLYKLLFPLRFKVILGNFIQRY